MLFDLRALGYFVAAYEERSVTAAARRCHVAQPSISMAIKGLEEALGVTLFMRSRHGLQPTAAGDRLHPKAVSLLAQSRALIGDFQQPPQAPLTLHLQADVLTHSVGPLLTLLARQIPDCRLHLVEEPGQARLRVTTAHCKAPADSFVPLWQEPYVMLVPQGHAMRFTPRFALKDLHGLPMIERPYCSLHLSFRQLLTEYGVTPDVRATAHREEQLLQLVSLGLGLAVVPRSHAAHAGSTVVRELDPAVPFVRQVGLACAPHDGEMLRHIHQMAPALAGAHAFTAARPLPQHATGEPA